MNLATYRTRIKQVLGLNDDDNTLIDGWVNEGVVDFVRRTECDVNCSNLTTTSGVWKYTLPSSPLTIKTVWIDESDTRVVPLDSADLVRMRTAAPSVEGTYLYYALEGSDLLMLYPTPSSAYTINTLYVPTPAAMSSTASSPTEIPAEYHQGPELYALWRGADYRDDESSKQGTAYREQYLEFVQETIRTLNRKVGSRLPVARASRRGLRRRPQRDVYP